MTSFPNPEEICTELLREAKCSAPPTDLAAISALWPGLKVSEADLDKEGYLIFLGVQGAELMLRKADPPNRKRFTFAHELGHWILSSTQDGKFSLKNHAPVLRSTHAQRQSPEETWCNEFAANLLMPTVDILRYLHGDPKDVPRRLATGHVIFRVSEQAFLSRVADALGWIVLDLIHGQDLHRVGRRFIRRREERNVVERTIDELLKKTRLGVPFPRGCISVPGFVAYGFPKNVTRQASTYLVCLIPNPPKEWVGSAF